jgi:hypothetical protein
VEPTLGSGPIDWMSQVGLIDQYIAARDEQLLEVGRGLQAANAGPAQGWGAIRGNAQVKTVDRSVFAAYMKLLGQLAERGIAHEADPAANPEIDARDSQQLTAARGTLIANVRTWKSWTRFDKHPFWAPAAHLQNTQPRPVQSGMVLRPVPRKSYAERRLGRKYGSLARRNTVSSRGSRRSKATSLSRMSRTK